MRIDSEEDYFKEANYKEGEELASKYMKRATDKASSFIDNKTLKLNLKAAVSVVERFFHKRYIRAVYVYEKAGGWYGDIMCERDGETYTFGTPNAKPFRAKKEAIEYVIGAMAQVIAVGDGKIKPVDSSGTPAEFIDFRLYNEFYVLPMTSVKVLAKIIELQKMKRDCTTEDVIDECRKVIHDEMSKPADIRDNSLIMDRMLALIACDVCMVNQPIGWEGDPLDMLVPAKEQ